MTNKVRAMVVIIALTEIVAGSASSAHAYTQRLGSGREATQQATTPFRALGEYVRNPAVRGTGLRSFMKAWLSSTAGANWRANWRATIHMRALERVYQFGGFRTHIAPSWLVDQ